LEWWDWVGFGGTAWDKPPFSAGIFVVFAVLGSGSGADSLTRLSMIVFVVGLFTNGAIAGLYAMFARIIPAHVRATGTGFAIGVGRGGAALAPMIAGYIFQSGYTLQIVASILAIGSIVGAVVLAMLKIPKTP
jgi:MFS family permease